MKQILLFVVLVALLLNGCASIRQANIDAIEQSYWDEIERLTDRKTGDIKLRAIKLNTFTKSEVPGQPQKRKTHKVDVVFRKNEIEVIGNKPASIPYSAIESFATEMTKEETTSGDIILLGVTAPLVHALNAEHWVVLKRHDNDPVFFTSSKHVRELFVRVLKDKLQ